jgi:hypothetical protein
MQADMLISHTYFAISPTRIRATRARSVLDRAPAGTARGGQLAAYPVDAGVLPVINPGSEWRLVMVRVELDEGPSRRGIFTGLEERGVSRPGQAAATQNRVVQPPAAVTAKAATSAVIACGW